jgi:hypothetical protein
LTRGEWELVIAGFGIPLWLAGRALLRYIKLGRVAVPDRMQMQIGLAAAIATTVMWLAVFAMIDLQDHNRLIYSLARQVNPGDVELINIGFCALGLACSLLRSRKGEQTGALRNAIAASCALLAFAWVALALNPH